jgi:dsDNA-binding SOS-regulon protein
MMNNEVLTLTRRINSIFERVYSLNESLSVEDRRYLILGFEDGINEEFIGRALGKARNFVKGGVERAKKGYEDASKKGQEYYERGKKLAGDAWDSIKEFGNKIIKGIEAGFNKAVSVVVSNYNSFVSVVTKSYQDAVNSISEAYDKMKNKAESFKEYFKGIYNDIIAKTTKLIADTKQKMIDTGDDLNKWIESNKESISNKVEESKRSGIESMNKLSKIISDILSKTKKTAKDIIGLSIFICVSPIIIIVNGVKKIPGIYDYVVSSVNEYINKQIQEYKLVTSEFDSRNDKNQGDEEVKNKYKELLSKWKEEQKKSGKNTNPGEGTRKSLKRQAMELVGEGYVIKTFERFNFINE